MIEKTGLGHISAKIIKDSASFEKNRITTFELEYPRFIHSEFMTHRMLSKNSASSRAIPVQAMHDSILAKPQAPIHWGKNQTGMQADVELTPIEIEQVEALWNAARMDMLGYAKTMSQIGLHKQAVNRITEPFMQMKVVVTATEWENYFWLRNHRDAQPEIRELARLMWECYTQSEPDLLYPGDWHLPYVHTETTAQGVQRYLDANGEALTLEQARKVSASCCAQVSYRKNDDSLEKAERVFERLVYSEPVHASPVEHQATPMSVQTPFTAWQPGITHQTRNGEYWSGNFRNWIQYRQLIPNHSRMKV